MFRWTSPDLLGAVLAAGVAVVAIVALGMYSMRAGERTQQAGDDLYYLGLLFTLWSLILALIFIFIVDSEGSATARTNQLVGNFGVALFSTVAGIIGRVLLQSGADTPAARRIPQSVDAESELQRLQAEALDEARRARDQARQARDAFSHFTRMTLAQAEQTRTHTERLVREFDEHMTRLAEAGLRDASTAWEDAMLAMRSQAEELVSQVDAAATAVTARTEAAWQGVASRAEAATAEARGNVDAINAEVAAMLDRLAAINRVLPPLAAAMDRTQTSVDRFGRTAVDAATSLDTRAAEISSANNALVRGSRDHGVASVETYRSAVDRLMNEAHDQLRETGERCVQVVEEFQDAARKQREAGERAATAAEDLTRRMSDEVAYWTALAERTSQTLVNAIDQLTKIVGKA